MSTTKTKSRKWKPGQAAKFRATMAARRAAQGTIPPAEKVPKRADALVYLRHAEAHITKSLRSGRLKRMDHAHLLTLLALSTLQDDG